MKFPTCCFTQHTEMEFKGWFGIKSTGRCLSCHPDAGIWLFLMESYCFRVHGFKAVKLFRAIC
jgi:hypothetical protein